MDFLMQLLTSLCCSVCAKMVHIIVMHCPGQVPFLPKWPALNVDSFVVFLVLCVMAPYVFITWADCSVV